MEFDTANRRYSGSEPLTETNYKVAKQQFAMNGYQIPQVVFWNVDAKAKTIPVRKGEIGTALVSGLTPAIFESVLNGKIMNPEQMMLDTLYQDKYDFVKLILGKPLTKKE